MTEMGSEQPFAGFCLSDRYADKAAAGSMVADDRSQPKTGIHN